MTRRDQLRSTTGQEIVGGLVLGAILGATATYLINPKTCQQIKETLLDTYQTISERAQDLASDVIERAEEVSQGHFFAKKTKNHTSRNMIIGAIAGSVLGASAIIFLSGSGSEIYKGLANNVRCLNNKVHQIGEQIEEKTYEAIENFEDRVNLWVKIAQNLFNKLNGVSKNFGKETALSENAPLGEALKWAVAGFRLFQSLKK